MPGFIIHTKRELNKSLYTFFTEDHHRLEALLDKATATPGFVDPELYHQFRTGLLKHIKMEEKVLFPAAQRANGNQPIPLAARLKLDHGAITSLMVVPPTEEVIKVIRHVLEKHDLLEEEPGGMYDICEKLTAGETEALLEELGKATEVPVHPFNEASYALEVAKRTLARAGFDYADIVSQDQTQNS
ncbi:MAG: hemerythrin domain-containing protein [Bacteroidia bacterium]|nr:hemerythrin domain-containing protein [Bacteroidia bacterium]MCZ2278189.1 hemerythrin domain-containing protein [Bacteroidia bacterium]